ncbi:MAG: NAD-dependent epimerase/dehydratase family protein, partial [Firmicutes bacterium]|nr:NAD-dependent epimerase/dehydratase family protein [Bacillota bacterium]
FIGSHVIDLLCERGHDVIAIDLAPVPDYWSPPDGARFLQLDVAESETERFVAQSGADVIFHLAAQASVPLSIERPVRDAQTSVIGLLRLLEGARASGSVRRIVFSSTAAVYGDPVVAHPLPETTATSPISPYGATKVCAESLLRVYAHLHGIGYAILRYANVYGPRQGLTGEGGVVAIFCQRLLSGQPLHLFGDGLHTRDYVYVGDVARANLLAALTPGDLCAHISTGVETSNAELIEHLFAAAGRSVAVLREPERQGDIRRSVLSPEYAAGAMGWRPEVSLQDGLERTLEFMTHHVAG